MTGIDKIITQIESDTQIVCNEMLSAADNKAQSILQKAKAEADKAAKSIEKASDDEYSDIIARGKSAASLEQKKTLLKTKQELISLMLENTKNHIKELSDNEYFDFLLKMIGNNSLKKDGVIALNKRDLSRLPSDFAESASKAAGYTLSLSDTPADIDSGFVLIYGGIEENCSVDAVFYSKYEELSDKVSRLLFG